MNVRRATEADEAVLRELWEAFEQEVQDPPGFVPETWDEEWKDTLDDIRTGGVFLALDDDGEALGVARFEAPARGSAHLQLAYVRPDARRHGVTRALLRAGLDGAKAAGAGLVSLEVLSTNEAALAVWRRLGFREFALLMATPVDALDAHLTEARVDEVRASTHVQTDDRTSVDRALQQFIPRLQAPEVRPNGSWIRIADPTLDLDRDAQARFARELSERLGAVTVALALEGPVVRFRLYERGRMVDEYLSVPSFYGPLSKGDELALEANPTLVARLTGADRDEVRRIARTAPSPVDLPASPDLYVALAELMGLEP